MTTEKEYNELWDENIALRDRLAEIQIEVMDAHDALMLMSNLWVKLPLTRESKEQRQYRKGYTQAMHRAAKCISRALQTED
tara:strand:+ start:274 stop:516 length:243 start_codon:yes stop_codon:yes gene_type:complete